MNYISIRNNETIPISSIPELDYSSFLELNVFSLMKSCRISLCKLFWIPPCW